MFLKIRYLYETGKYHYLNGYYSIEASNLVGEVYGNKICDLDFSYLVTNRRITDTFSYYSGYEITQLTPDETHRVKLLLAGNELWE